MARREKRRALVRLGQELAAAGSRQGGAFEQVAACETALADLETGLLLSLYADRADYSAVSAWARPLVILRGLMVRAVLRQRRRRGRAERALAWSRLAEAALAEGLPELPAAAHVRAARAEAEAARDETGDLPPAARALARESWELARSVLRELRNQLFPRVPALAGLLVGWWVASTFTDSQLSATLHSWGIGSGPRHAVGGETLRALGFWLPLCAAAICSYAGSRLAAFIRSRYEA